MALVASLGRYLGQEDDTLFAVLANCCFNNEQGLVPAPSPLRRLSTRSAAMAAKSDKLWAAKGGLAVMGPEDLSYEDMAAIMSGVLGKSLASSRLGRAFKEGVISFGASEAMAQHLLEMFAAIDDGFCNTEPRAPETHQLPVARR